MQIRTFFLNLATFNKISKQLNIPRKDIFKRNKNIKQIFFRNFSEKHCVLTLRSSHTPLKDQLFLNPMVSYYHQQVFNIEARRYFAL